MNFLSITDWDKWQTYRKDRGTPPWIKVYRNLMTDPQWAILSDAEKGQLVSLWICAADRDGIIPADKKILKKICCLDVEPNLKKFIQLQFLTDHDNQMTTTCQPNDAPETETETETEKRKSIQKEKVSLDDLDIKHIEEWLTAKRVAGIYLTIDEHRLLEKFKDYCLSKGKTYKDYVAGFRNAFEWDNAPTKGNGNGKQSKSELADQAIERSLARFDQRDQQEATDSLPGSPELRHLSDLRS